MPERENKTTFPGQTDDNRLNILIRVIPLPSTLDELLMTGSLRIWGVISCGGFTFWITGGSVSAARTINLLLSGEVLISVNSSVS
jgi:hypothetical protein